MCRTFFVAGEPLPELLSRITANYCISRHVLGNHSTGRDDSSFSD